VLFHVKLTIVFNLVNSYNWCIINISCCAVSRKADDCFQLGKVAYDNNDFYHAVTWLGEALRIGDMESNKTTSRAVVLDYLSFALYKVGLFKFCHSWLVNQPLLSTFEDTMQAWQPTKDVNSWRFQLGIFKSWHYWSVVNLGWYLQRLTLLVSSIATCH